VQAIKVYLATFHNTYGVNRPPICPFLVVVFLFRKEQIELSTKIGYEE